MYSCILYLWIKDLIIILSRNTVISALWSLDPLISPVSGGSTRAAYLTPSARQGLLPARNISCHFRIKYFLKIITNIAPPAVSD